MYSKYHTDGLEAFEGLSSSKRCKRIRRFLLKRLVPGCHTKDQWLSRVGEFNKKCAYCLVDLTDSNPPTRDHMTPVCWGSASSNSIDNIVPACKRCNSKKGNLNMLQYLLATMK